MAYFESIKRFTLPANADLSSYQYYLVDVNSSGNAAVVASQGAKCVGVLLNDPSEAGAACEIADIAGGGVCKIKAASAITCGDEVTSSANGRIETAASSDVVIGRALEAAAAADIVISVKLGPTYIKA